MAESKDVTLKIDDRDVTVPSGTLVIEAAPQDGLVPQLIPEMGRRSLAEMVKLPIVARHLGPLLKRHKRSIDVMRQRGNQYREHLAETVPHVLDYKAELVMDGRTQKRPVNYLLVRIIPPVGVEIEGNVSGVKKQWSGISGQWSARTRTSKGGPDFTGH
jgi:hypothetical protein